MDFLGFKDWVIRPGSLGKPMIGGARVEILDEEEREAAPGTVGQVAVWRNDKWAKIGDSDVDTSVSFLRAIEEIGIFHTPFNVVSSDHLRKAMKEPENNMGRCERNGAK